MLLFVYGTLKKGFPNHAGLMDKAEHLGTGTSLECYPLLVAGRWHSPVLKEEVGVGYQVSGELYSVDADTLTQIDTFEGTDRKDGYYRKAIIVVADHKRASRSDQVKADTYFKQPSAIKLVSEGPLRCFPNQNQYVPQTHR
jgi:gamma-glutamylaminecyclotransferase